MSAAPRPYTLVELLDDDGLREALEARFRTELSVAHAAQSPVPEVYGHNGRTVALLDLLPTLRDADLVSEALERLGRERVEMYGVGTAAKESEKMRWLLGTHLVHAAESLSEEDFSPLESAFQRQSGVLTQAYDMAILRMRKIPEPARNHLARIQPPATDSLKTNPLTGGGRCPN